MQRNYNSLDNVKKINEYLSGEKIGKQNVDWVDKRWHQVYFAKDPFVVLIKYRGPASNLISFNFVGEEKNLDVLEKIIGIDSGNNFNP